MRYEYRTGKFSELYALFAVLWVAVSLVFLSMLVYVLDFQANCTQACPADQILRSIGFAMMFLLMFLFCLGNAASLYVTSDSTEIVKRYDKLWLGPRGKQALVGLHVLWQSLFRRNP